MTSTAPATTFDKPEVLCQSCGKQPRRSNTSDFCVRCWTLRGKTSAGRAAQRADARKYGKAELTHEDVAKIAEIQAAEDAKRNADAAVAEEELIMPESCMWGYLGEMARKLQAPLGYAYPAVLAVYAGRWNMATTSVRSNLFVDLVADIHGGKSRTARRAMHSIIGSGAEKYHNHMAASDPGLVEMLGGKDEKKIEDKWAPPTLIYEDEMQDAMNKMAIEKSSLPNKLNKLFYNDEIAHTKNKSHLVAYANVTVLSCLTCADSAEFQELWGKNTVSGLYDRHIFGYAPLGWKWDDMWEADEQVKPEERRPAPVKVDKEIFDLKDEWANSEGRGRLAEIALRVAVITTAAEGDKQKDGYAHVTEKCMRRALEFGEFQEKFRAKFKPSRADNSYGGKLSELIMEDFRRCKDKDGNFAWAKWRDRYRINHWERKDGRAIAVQRDALVKAEMLEAEMEPKLNALREQIGEQQTGRYRVKTWKV
jgi:hypothetical protein